MNKRIRNFIQPAAVLGLPLLLAACAPTTPRWDSTFGQSVRASMAAQVSDPGAVRNTNPVAGMDGKAARAADEQYVHSFTAPAAPPPVMSISLGDK